MEIGPSQQETVQWSEQVLPRPKRKSRQAADVFLRREKEDHVAEEHSLMVLQDRKVKDRNKR